MEQIRLGHLQVGDCLPSLGELRAELGISQATFDKVHQQLEAEGLVSRERGRGSFVLQGKKSQASSVIGYFQPESEKLQHHAYFAHLLAGIRRAAQSQDKNILLIGQPEKFSDWDYIGAAIFCLDSIDIHEMCPGIPAALPVARALYPWKDAPSVLADEETGQYMAARHLLELGHRRIAYMGRFHESGLQARLRGYRKALMEYEIVPQDDWFFAFQWEIPHQFAQENFPKNGYLNMNRWLEEGFAQTGCTAILVQNDMIALGGMEALHDAGLQVPQDISVVGFDGAEAYQLYSRRLTTIKVPLEDIGEKTVELLYQPPSSTHSCLELPCQFIPGGTVAKPRLEPLNN